MKKIPSLFKRDFDNNPKLVTREYNDGMDWVINSEGFAFRKWDGTACMIKDGILYKRYDAKNGKPAPKNGIPCQDPDPITGHWPHWIPATRDNKADLYIWEAYDNWEGHWPLIDGTYEAVGPKINGNADGFPRHQLMMHRHVAWAAPTDFDCLKLYFEKYNIEGLVWHHESGYDRMAKIKRSDFGLPWPVKK